MLYVNFLLSLFCLYQVECYVMFLLAKFWKYPISLRKHSCQTNRYCLLSFCQFIQEESHFDTYMYGIVLTHIRIQMWSEFSLFFCHLVSSDSLVHDTSSFHSSWYQWVYVFHFDLKSLSQAAEQLFRSSDVSLRVLSIHFCIKCSLQFSHPLTCSLSLFYPFLYKMFTSANLQIKAAIPLL